MGIIISAILTFALFCSNVLAQPKPRNDVFRTDTQLVEVSVIVRDGKGNAVTNLRQDDFEVLDNGKKQNIRVFHLEDYSSPGVKEAAASTPASGVFTNRVPMDSGAGNPVTVLVIDAADTWSSREAWADLVYARDQVLKFLQQLRPEDRLGIYLMGTDRFWVLNEYNATCADILSRLAAWKQGADPAAKKYYDVWTEFAGKLVRPDPETLRAISWRSRIAVGASSSESAPPRFNSFEVLRDVGAHLASIPGRKNMILISGTLTFGDAPKQLVHALVRSSIAVYTIDPGGLAPFQIDASFAIPRGVHPGQAAGACVSQANSTKKYLSDLLQTSLLELADWTGGRAFVNTNDIRGAIRHSFEDSQVSYTLGFYLAAYRSDGEYHSLRVKIPRRSDLRIRCRSGYLEPARPSPDPKIRRFVIERLARSALDASRIELRARVAPATDHYELDLKIGVADISSVSEGDSRYSDAEVILVQRDEFGTEYDPQRETIRVAVKPENWEKAVREGVSHRISFRLHPKATSLRVMVLDLNSENAGTLTIPRPNGL